MIALKAITVYQPYASLIAVGCKTIETRSWATKYRGKLAIHAAKKFIYGIIGELCRNDPIWNETMKSLGIDYEKGFERTPLSHGAVIATCHLVDCKKIYKYASHSDIVNLGAMRPPEEPELSFGDYTEGRYGWILEDIRPLPEPIPAKGMQRLWSWEAPEQL